MRRLFILDQVGWMGAQVAVQVLQVNNVDDSCVTLSKSDSNLWPNWLASTVNYYTTVQVKPMQTLMGSLLVGWVTRQNWSYNVNWREHGLQRDSSSIIFFRSFFFRKTCSSSNNCRKKYAETSSPSLRTKLQQAIFETPKEKNLPFLPLDLNELELE